MRRGSRLAASGLALGVLLVSATASGYCRTTTCDPRRQACPRDAQGCMTGGIPLAWPEACVGFSVQRDGWHVDDVELRTLAPHPLFADGFESGGATHWSLPTP